MGDRANGIGSGVSSEVVYESSSKDAVDFARQLTESVRCLADVDYATSQATAELLVSQLCKELNLVQLMPIAKALNEDIIDIHSCSDTLRMRKCLVTLSSFKADAQQRSWSTHEDADLILENLATLQDLLRKADPRVSIHILAEDEYGRLYDLVEFYQMETRSVIRIALLDTLKLILSFQPSHASILLVTVLPVEIAQDILNDWNRVPKKFQLSLDVLTLLLSTGEQIPLQYYDVLNDHFASTLLNIIEDANQPEEASEAAIACLIAFNLHFREDNLIVMALRQRVENPTKLTEYLLLLFNKKVDPVWPYKAVECPYVSSVMKMLETLLRDEETSKAFYTNDVAVMVDIVLRELLNLHPSKVRTEYLILLKLLAGQNTLKLEGHLENAILDVVDQLQHNSVEDGSTEQDGLYFREITKLLKPGM